MTTDTHPRMTAAERSLLLAARRWMRDHKVTYDYLRTLWRYPDGAAVTLLYGGDVVRPAVGTTRKYSGTVTSWNDFSYYDVTTVTEAVDVLVALGYLPSRFSTAYRVGWVASARESYLRRYESNIVSRTWPPVEQPAAPGREI